MNPIFHTGQSVIITAGNDRDGHYAGRISRVWDMSGKRGPQLYTVITHDDLGYHTYVRSESSITPNITPEA
jgi:hypothetical protein